MKNKAKTLRILSIIGIIISFALPLISAAQVSNNQVLSQQVTANSYTFSTPDDFTFPTTFTNPNTTTSLQKIWYPNQESDLIKFVDLRGSSGGAFSVNAYMSDLVDAGAGTRIDYENIAIATVAQDGNYTIDMDANNSISAANETAVAPLHYDGNLVNGQIPTVNYTNFNTDTATTSQAMTILNGALPEGEDGRTGSFSISPALLINVPANTYGNFTGTLTIELVLS